MLGTEAAVKTAIALVVVGLMVMFSSCGKDESSPAGPSTTYDLTDVVGTWTGEAQNDHNTVSLDLDVDSEGNVSGSGVSSQWSVDSEGEVTGSGSFGFIAGSSYVVAAASWSLQLNTDNDGLSGSFNVAYSTLHDMDVSLTKQ
jgi:hypothetical protein